MAKRKSLARVLATALVLAMLVPGIAHGAGQTSSANMGAGGVVSSAYTRLMGDPGAVIGLQLVPNTLTKKEKSEIEENGADDAHYDEVGAATVKQYLYKYPDFFTVGELTGWTALIQTYNGQANAGYKNYFVDGTNKRSNTWPAKQFYTVRQGSSASTSWKPNLLSDELTDKQLEDLGKGELSFDIVKAYRKNNKGEVEKAVDKFVAVFSNTGNVSTYLNGLLDYNATSEKAKLKNAATYLDVLIMVNYMAGNSTDAVIRSYLKTANQAGSEEFAVVFIGSVVSWEDQANNFRDWYTLPTYYAAATGKGVNNYQKILPDGITLRSVTEWGSRNSSSSGNYKARRAAYMSSLYKKYNAKGAAKSDSNSQRMMSMNQSAMWWSSAEGAIGGMSNWEAALSFNPTNLYGIPSGNTGYTYYSSMGAKLLKDEYETDGNIVITVDPQKKKVAPGDKTKVTVTVDLTSDQKQITATEKAFKYAEKMGYGEVDGSKMAEGYFPEGEEVKGIDYEEEHYYSEPEGAYVEIKEGSPGHETFEAMAGVPTTEKLYIGAGATEFMLNMDVKHEISEGNPTRVTRSPTQRQTVPVWTPGASVKGYTVPLNTWLLCIRLV